ncbi:RNA methyltransferase [Marinilongibacter aquaticus]|uniref:RNA methyltransferase n=1 Tax=Marinilongibacter aquaticus TaxID=2975157 RepID=UPI0021BD1CF2|nr:RNA methyltransferase [Marinilongibacter aquaticus]UBM60514.1 RNA methyltransferase [Marinilongibacter aquaticus]
MDQLGRKDVSSFKSSKKFPICIVLDNIRSLQNVGSFFRTADSFLIESLYLCGITGTPPNKEIEKTALGSTHSVDFKYFENTLDALHDLKQKGFRLAALEQTDKSVWLQDFIPETDEKLAFIFGNEVFGVQNEVLEMADIVLEIPQFGTKHSLNVSVSAGIVLWDTYLKNSLNLCKSPS